MQESSKEVSVISTKTHAELHDKPSLTEVLPALVNSSESSGRHSPKPSGRARRLQPPFFKDRIERVLSKLRIKEVKNELDTIGNDTEEQQKYGFFDIIDLADNLQEEIKNVHLSTESVNTNFSTEMVRNSDGEQEIRLQREDGESMSLNDLSPKGFRFQESDRFQMDKRKRIISYVPEVMKSKGGVLMVLHEIDHAHNYESGKIEKSPFYTLSLNEKVRAGIVYAIQFTKRMGLRGMPTPQWLKDKQQSWMARDERAAHAYALQEGRALEKQGFHIFAGFENTEDIRDFINTALMTYEAKRIYSDFFSSNKQSDFFASEFVKQHVLDKKIEEAREARLPIQT
jgi:hypothetical protein